MRTKSNTFVPSRHSYSALGAIDWYGAEDAESEDEGSDENSDEESDEEGSSSIEQYGGFLRKLLGWDRTKQQERDVLRGQLYALEHGPWTERLLAAGKTGHLDVETAIADVKQRLETAEKEARGEILRNVGVTVMALGGGALVLTTVGLVAVKAYSGYKQAQLTGEQIKKLQAGS